ncbi:hypothetical protein BDW02DRAFT_566743 [Decorospora gaudefroyi]|uniref:DUF7730 domain-containing protein n=1 Tax=Decorospora gaudefroyi TaxID=184978 RepID=A0A6A5KM19_9PLEO|nr:hypothetical protein BDW02DRAFT_566743 [Decorospora gaudefroyi]
MTPSSVKQSKVHANHRVAKDHDQITSTNQLTSPLLRLPAELRNQIYSIALAPFRTTTIETYAREPFLTTTAAQKSLALLQTCRQMHSEATLPYYSTNTFEFRSSNHITRFVHAVGPARCAVIKWVRLVFQAKDIGTAKMMLQAAVDECVRVFPQLVNVWVQVQSLTSVPERTWFRITHPGKPELSVVFD